MTSACAVDTSPPACAAARTVHRRSSDRANARSRRATPRSMRVSRWHQAATSRSAVCSATSSDTASNRNRVASPPARPAAPAAADPPPSPPETGTTARPPRPCPGPQRSPHHTPEPGVQWSSPPPADRAVPRLRGGAAALSILVEDVDGTQDWVYSLSCRKTSVTVLHQDIGDTSGGLGGDTSAPRLGRWLPMNPSIPVSVSRSRSGPMTLLAGAVSTFCAEHGISRKSFYELRKRAKVEGPAAVLEPRTRRPRSSPSKLTDEVKEQAVAGAGCVGVLRAGPRADQRARQDARDGPGPGAIGGVAGPDLPRGRRGSTRAEEEATLGMAPVRLPSPERVLATRRHRVRADRRPQVRDLPAHRRPLPIRRRIPRRVGRDRQGRDHGGRQGHRRPRRAATTAVRQRHCAEPLTARVAGQLVDARVTPGVEAITGKPYKPTTQGKNERFHQTLFRYLDKQPLAAAWPNYRPRSTRSTTSTTPNVPTKDYRPRHTPDGLGGDREGRASSTQGRPAHGSTGQSPRRYQRPSHRRRPTCQPIPASGRSAPPAPSTWTRSTTRSTSNTGSSRSWSSPTATRSPSPTCKARSSPSTPDPHPESPTSATADPRTTTQEPLKRHRSPDTPTVTDVLIQNCHRCPETSHWVYRYQARAHLVSARSGAGGRPSTRTGS